MHIEGIISLVATVVVMVCFYRWIVIPSLNETYRWPGKPPDRRY